MRRDAGCRDLAGLPPILDATPGEDRAVLEPGSTGGTWPREWRLRKDQAAERPDVAIRTRAARIVDALGKAVAVEDRDRFPK